MITFKKQKVTAEDFYKLLFGGEKIEISEEVISRVKSSFDFLQGFSKDKIIYGINTGLGPMAQYRIDEADQIELQYNLIRSHSAGAGDPIPGIYVKSLMIARLITFLQGNSGIHPDIIHLLKEMINREIYPVIYEHGGVGASGDLVQLSHLGLALIGEGEVTHQGETRPTKEVFDEYSLQPLKMYIREGLGIINGTSAMSGIGVVNLIQARNILHWSVIISCLINEIVESYDDHFSFELNQVKLHEGQRTVSKWMRDILSDSQLIRRRSEHLYNNHIGPGVLNDKVQEYYSVRCIPQILGPVLDTLDHAESVVMNEVNSVDDNPIVDQDNENVFHGGNFHGDYVAIEMDKLKIAISKLSMLAERQLNFLLNSKLNGRLQPFVNLGKLGLNFGMQGIQFTATSTVAENQTLSFPAYIHSISCNNDNQDIVSMGTTAALIARKVIENAYEVVAIELIAVLQAVDYLEIEKKLSAFNRSVFKEVRDIIPKFIGDHVMSDEIRRVKEHLLSTRKKLS